MTKEEMEWELRYSRIRPQESDQFPPEEIKATLKQLNLGLKYGHGYED